MFSSNTEFQLLIIAISSLTHLVLSLFRAPHFFAFHHWNQLTWTQVFVIAFGRIQTKTYGQIIWENTACYVPLSDMQNAHEHIQGFEESCCKVTHLALFNSGIPKLFCTQKVLLLRSLKFPWMSAPRNILREMFVSIISRTIFLTCILQADGWIQPWLPFPGLEPAAK